jgi:hypothetical protein
MSFPKRRLILDDSVKFLTDARHGSHADKEDEEFDESAADHEMDIELLDAAERHWDPIVASSPITTVQTKHFGGQLRRIPPVQPQEENKKRM